MKMVIEIPEDVKAIIDRKGTNETVAETLWQAVKNGIQLPKGHGRLIDADALHMTDLAPEPWYSPLWGYNEYAIDDAQTIIEADEEAEI